MYIHKVYTGGIILELKFREKLCLPSKDALKDMINLGIDPYLLETIVEKGADYKNDKMSKNEIGRSIEKGKEIIFVKLVPTYSYLLDEEIWLIKHVGKRRR